MTRAPLVAMAVVGLVGCSFTPPENLDALPEVAFAIDSSVTDESIRDTQVFVELSEASASPITVDVVVRGGTAEAAEDYETPAATVTFPPNTMRAPVIVKIQDDGVEELEEDVVLELQSPEGAKLGAITMHDLKISANKLPRVRFGAADSNALESAGQQNFVLTLDKPSPVDVHIAYSWTGSAEQADHGLANGVLVITAGLTGEALAVPVTNDPTDEDDETIDVVLSAQDGAVIEPNMGQHIHTIQDEDDPPGIIFGAQASSAPEANNTSVEVKLVLASEKEVRVDYAAAGGGSAGTADYTVTAGTLVFAPGELTKAIPVEINNDTLDEEEETAPVVLTNAINGQLPANTTHVITINDNDNAPTLGFDQLTSSAGEAVGTHGVLVKLTAASGKNVQFSLTRAGTSAAGDATVDLGTHTITAGALSVMVDLGIVNDTADEDNETVILTLANVTNAGVGTASHTVTIQDNDNEPSVRFDPAVGNQSGFEGDSGNTTFNYVVVLSAASGRTVSVGIQRSGSAEVGPDFDFGTDDIPVVFQPGQTSKIVRVIVHGDNANGPPSETVTMTLQQASNASNAGDNQSRTHTIFDDD